MQSRCEQPALHLCAERPGVDDLTYNGPSDEEKTLDSNVLGGVAKHVQLFDHVNSSVRRLDGVMLVGFFLSIG